MSARQMLGLCVLGLGLLLGEAFIRPLAPRAWAQGRVAQRFDQLDKNSDGRLTPAELPAQAIFRRLDLDGDGEITRREAIEAVAQGVLTDRTPPEPQPAGDPKTPPAQLPLRQGPRPLRPGDHGVGRQLPDVRFIDLGGQARQLADVTRGRVTVFAMTSTSCPLSRKYLPTLVELIENSRPDVAWVLVNPLTTDERAEMQAAAEQCGERAIYVPDRDGTLAATLGAMTTTDVVVVDAARTVEYHGAVDDQYGLGYSQDAPRQRYLADALAAIDRGQVPLVAATEAPGCVLERPAPEETRSPVTYHNRISRLMQRHCVECHRAGGVGPFALDSHAAVVAHAGMIARVVERGLMPPWFAREAESDAGAGPLAGAAASAARGTHSPWVNDRSLSEAEKNDLLEWIAGGKPEGASQDAPRPRTFPEGWLIGTPDVVFTFAEPVAIKATGVMPYQQVVVETHLSEEKWVRAIEVQPGNRAVVHHVLVFVVGGEGEAGEPAEVADERGGFWGIYVPGNSTLEYPEGFAKRIPKGARLRFQMHYTPNGTATTDQTRIGLVWATEPPRHEVRVAGIVNPRISIPAGAANHREEATLRLPFDATVLGFLPHMHLRGKACRYELQRANGETTMLLDIPRYDFNWQLLYRYGEPLPLQAGDTLRFTAWYDNSAGNPANPDATRTVRWGPQTYDEMQLGYVEYYVPGVVPGTGSDKPGLGRQRLGRNGQGLAIETIFHRLDRDQDGQLKGDEIPEGQRTKLLRLDTNGDGAISLPEARRLQR